MVGRLLLIVLCVAVSVPAVAQQANRPTASWGSMPNGWIDHSGLNRYKTSFGAAQHQANLGRGHHGHGYYGHGHYGYGVGRYPLYVNPGYYGYSGVYGVSPYGVGYRCPRCLSPYCFDPFCTGTFVSGLSLTVVAPSVVAVPPVVVAPQLAARPAVGFGGNIDDPFPAAAGVPARSTGLPWLDRLRQQQAAAFGNQEAAMAARREEVFESAVDVDVSATIRRKVAELKPSNEEGRRRSDQLIAEADRFFSEQQFPKAAQRYRQALAVAPNYPKALFRAGHYFMATGDYENSLLAYLMALEISKDIHQPGFRLDDLYRGNALDKMAYIDRLAEASLKDPEDAGLVMLVGLTLFYDQQIDRAEEFFRSAAESEGPQSVYASWFLRGLRP